MAWDDEAVTMKACRQVADGMNARGFRLLEIVAKERAGANVLISPYSISSAFGLLASGAKGKTKEEILSTLGIPDDPAILQRMAKALDETATGMDGEAYRAFIRQGNRQEKRGEVAPTKIAEVLSANSVWQGKDREGLPSTALFPEYRDVKAIRLPYKDDRFSMVAILPREGLGWEGRIGTLVAQKFKDIIEKARWEEVTYVKLPKLDMDFDLDLRDTLVRNGMPTALSERPDLSGICEWAKRSAKPDSPYRYFVGKIVHKTKSQMDEEKTGAAAATAIAICAMGCCPGVPPPPPPPKYFYANRPFVLALYDGQTGLVLFAGVVNAPKAVDAPAGSWRYRPEPE